MKIKNYKWSDVLGKFPDYTCNEEEGAKRLRWYIPMPSIATPLTTVDEWIIPTLDLYKKQKRPNYQIPDCIKSALNEFVSESAKSILQEIFTKDNVKLYPVKVSGANQMYYMVVPAHHDENKKMDIFSKKGESPSAKYVTQKFIDTVEKNSLTGFCFQGAEGDAFYVNKHLKPKQLNTQETEKTSFPKQKDWLRKVEDLANQKDWHAIDDLNHQVMQNLLDTNNTEAMMSFYEEALKSLVSNEQYQKIKPADMTRFYQKLDDAFEKAVKKAKSNKNIKSIYCEYFYDGGDSCELNLYLCEKSPDEDESWASEFGEDGFVKGPTVNDFLNYDPDFSFEPALEVVAKQYVQSHFIRSCLSIIVEKKIKDWPIGFAEHDGLIFMIKE